jgi:hypothetical protein
MLSCYSGGPWPATAGKDGLSGSRFVGRGGAPKKTTQGKPKVNGSIDNMIQVGVVELDQSSVDLVSMDLSRYSLRRGSPLASASTVRGSSSGGV